MWDRRLIRDDRIKSVDSSCRIVEELAPRIYTLLTCRIPSHLGTESKIILIIVQRPGVMQTHGNLSVAQTLYLAFILLSITVALAASPSLRKSLKRNKKTVSSMRPSPE